MGEFIKIRIDEIKCRGIADCGQCEKLCPVNIFEAAGEIPDIVDENEDECTLCDLCLNGCETDAIEIIKLYER